MAQESTAINALIHLAQGKRIDADDEAPDLFSSPPPPKAVSLRPAAAGSNPQQYRIPTALAGDDSETEMYNSAAHDTAPAVPKILPNVATMHAASGGAKVPKILPNVATMLAQPQQVRAVPSILQGPIAPHPQVHHIGAAAPQSWAQAQAQARVKAEQSSPSQQLSPSTAQSHAQQPHAHSPNAQHAQQSRSQAHSAQSNAQSHTQQPQAHSAQSNAQPSHAQQPRSAQRSASTSQQRSQAQPAYAHVVLPPVAQAVSPGFYASTRSTRAASIAPRAPAPYLVARELASSAFRSKGGLIAVLAIALGVGVYLAVASSRGEPKPQGPTERDRAIAIMNGTAQPDPPSVKAPAPNVVVAPAPTAEPIEAAPAAPRDEPIEATPIATAPTAEPIEVTPVAAPAVEPVATDEISVDEIEMEPAAARPAKRASRSSRKPRVAAVEAPRTSRSKDPVLAILDEKPAKKAILNEAKKPEKPKAEPKAPKNLATTEIAAPRGAAASNGTGKVTITSDKPALIFLDGRPTGKKAPTALVIPAGDHQITLLDPETKKAKTATIKLEANKSASISKLFN